MKIKPAASPLFYESLASPLGPLWMVTGPAGLSYLFRGQTESEFFTEIHLRSDRHPIKKQGHHSCWHSELGRYFSGEKITLDGPIHFLEGSPFQQKVWKTLRRIPYGTLRSYQWIGDQLSMKGAARAVGNACGKNPIPIIIPCHRVVRQNGTLGGYTGGVQIKKKLLEIEGHKKFL